MSDRVALGMAGLTLSLQLKNRELDAMTLADLHARAERLPPEDALYRAITECVVMVEVAAPDDLPAIGEQLHRAIDQALRPVPPDLHRVDIHG